MFKFSFSYKIFLALLIFIIGFSLISVIRNVSVLFYFLLVFWVVLFVWAIKDYSRNIAFICFLVSFFVFLLGREICFYYFDLPKYYQYLMRFDSQTYSLLIVSLLSFLLGYLIKYDSRVRLIRSNGRFESPLFFEAFKESSRLVFLICLIVSFYAMYLRIVHIKQIGYVESYMENYDVGIPFVVRYVSAFLITSFCFYLSSYPSKKKIIVPLLLMETYAVISLLTGSRFNFIGISLLIITYLIIRNRDEKGWISKRVILLLVCFTPLIIILMSYIEAIRSKQQFQFSSILYSLESFFDSTGGSINCIKRVFYYENEIKDLSFTSFSTLREVLFENIIMRKLFGVTTYSGNSVAHALYGHSLEHRLSYYEYGLYYLSGHGVGSSYIAELFADFKIVGVILGNVFYGYCLRLLSDLSNRKYFKNGVLLVLFYSILHAPRGNFDSFFSNIISLYSLLGILIIFIISLVIENLKTKDKRQKNSKSN